MKKLYNALFYVPKYGKVRDSVMTARAVLSLTVILLCLASMAITAYAWFSYNITSAPIRLTAARFGTVAVVRQEGGDEVPLTVDAEGVRTAVLTGGETYIVELALSEDSTAETGFCILSGEGIGTWHTWQLGVDGAQQRRNLTFYLKPEKDMQITLRDHWGTSSSYGDPNAVNYIGNENTVELQVAVTPPPQPVPPTTVASTTPASTGPAAKEMSYTIQEGDTLTAIAERFGVSVEELCQLNDIEDPDVILVGAPLQIPMTEEEG